MLHLTAGDHDHPYGGNDDHDHQYVGSYDHDGVKTGTILFTTDADFYALMVVFR